MVISSHALKFEFILSFFEILVVFLWAIVSGILCLCGSDHKEAVKF